MSEYKAWWMQTLTLRITGEQRYVIAETHCMSIEFKVVVPRVSPISTHNIKKIGHKNRLEKYGRESV